MGKRKTPEERAATKKAYVEKTREYRLAQMREYYSQNRKAGIGRARKSGTGCTIEQYDRLFASQDGACAICGIVTSRSLHADHDHSTGKIRALLCNRCNVGVGWLEQPLRPKWDAYLLLHREHGEVARYTVNPSMLEAA